MHRRVSKVAMTLVMAAALPGAQDREAPTSSDVVVIGRRILGVHIVYTLNGPFLHQCSVDPPTDDPNLDIAACQLVRICVARGNTIPDNVERCLKRLLADIKAGKTVVHFDSTTKTATISRAPRTSADNAAPTVIKESSSPQDQKPVDRDVIVIAPISPKPGRWRYTVVTASMSPGMPSPPPRSWEQCVAEAETTKTIEAMLNSAPDGGSFGCHIENVAFAGGRVSANRVCVDQHGRSRGSISGRYGADRIELQEDVERFELGRRSDGGSDRDILRSTTGRRRGEC